VNPYIFSWPLSWQTPVMHVLPWQQQPLTPVRKQMRTNSHADYILYRTAQYLWILSMELASCHKIILRLLLHFWKLCVPCLQTVRNKTVYRVWIYSALTAQRTITVSETNYNKKPISRTRSSPSFIMKLISSCYFCPHFSNF